MLSSVGPLFGLIAAGFVATRLRLLGDGAADALNRFTVYLALPALLFAATADTPAAAFGGGRFALAVALTLVLTFALALLLAPRARHRADRAIEALASSYPNTGFMGIPLVASVFGDPAVPLAIVAALLTVCALFALALVLVDASLASAAPGGASGGAPFRAALVLGRNPIILAPIAGAAWHASGGALPRPLHDWATVLGAASTPVALVTIGAVLAGRRPGGGSSSSVAELRAVLRVVGVKLALQPLLAFALGHWLFHLDERDLRAAVLLLALPIGTGPFMLAKLYDRADDETGQAVLVSTVLSLATLPAAVALLGR